MLWPVAVVASVVAADATSKLWARHHADTHWSAFGGVLQIRQVRNAGAAFGLGDHYPGIILATAVIATLAVAWWLAKAKSTGERLWVAVILGGALGNLVDRLADGTVTDWIHVAWYPPTFNLADVAIRIGAVLAVVYWLWAHRQARATPTQCRTTARSVPQLPSGTSSSIK